MNKPARLSAVPELSDRSTLRSGHATTPPMSAAPAATALPAGDPLDLPLRRAVPEVTRGAAALLKLGVATPRQALFYLPFRYDDFSDLRSLGELAPEEKQSALVRVTEVKLEAGFGRRPQRVIAQLADDSGS